MAKFRDAQIRAALLRVKTAESFTVPGMRRLTQDEVANYYGDGASCPRDIWQWLNDKGYITPSPARLTNAGREWLESHSKDRQK